MRFPIHIMTDMVKWQAKNWWQGRTRYPFVLMLEPLHTCNLACIGCSPERYSGDLKDRLSLDECLQSVDEAGAPVVSICGGEPTIYPELPELIDGIIARKRHIYLCTNGLLLDRFFKKGKPHKRLSINVHLDGMKRTHDLVTDRAGVFDKAIEMIKEGKRLGYQVCTNTTVFRETDVAEIEEMCAFLDSIGVDGMLISPGYHYEPIKENHFLIRDEIHQKFKRVLELSKKYRLYSTPLFLQFAAGERDYPCTPWGNPTRTPKGWKGPCYLIEKQQFATWGEFWNGVDWDYWESRKDPLCQNCKMHSGFEASVVRHLGGSMKDMATMARWNFSS
ncbi:MAG: adenosyl-hopene transferase HpnH [Deltaproteobacteria bacterium]|nr:adenosyl-hopene transferase HpnH [Deltaproteobacteria bacterium]MBI3388406.1 adenosyl-hopene transferase HpnH [Deltaproteobacteria bacterium]